MSGWKDWAIGEVVTESEFQSFVQDQVVQVYDDATDRDNTLGANVTEGMVCYLKDVNQTQVYDGASWVQVGEGDITGVTAGDGLTGGGTSGDVSLDVDMTYINTNASIAQSQVTDLVSDLSGKASTTHASTHESGGSDEIEIAQSQVTGLDTGTEGFTALSNGSSGLSYQPVSHNYIINGAFDIWQRGDSITVSTGAFGADRWRAVQFCDMDKSTDTPSSDFKYSAKVTAPDATNFHGIATRLEAQHCYLLAGKDVTVSFWIKPNQDSIDNAGYFSLSYATGATDDDWASSTTIGDSQFFNDLGLTADTWQKVTYTATVSTSATNGIAFTVLPNGSVTGTNPGIIYITGVQLEAGSIATPFKRNANNIAGEELACFRYYYRINTANDSSVGVGAFNTSTTSFVSVTFPAKMRATPTVLPSASNLLKIFDAGTSRVSTGLSGASVSRDRAEIRLVTDSGTAGNAGLVRGANTGFIEFNGAEL